MIDDLNRDRSMDAAVSKVYERHYRKSKIAKDFRILMYFLIFEGFLSVFKNFQSLWASIHSAYYNLNLFDILTIPSSTLTTLRLSSAINRLEFQNSQTLHSNYSNFYYPN